MDFNIEEQIYLNHMKELDEVQELIDKLDFENSLNTKEFVQYDDSEIITDIISNEEF